MRETVYFGTYTRKTSQGIYQAQFDTSTGELSQLSLIAKEENPSYLAFDELGRLYSVSTLEKKGGVAAFSPTMELLNHLVETGPAPCYIAVDAKRSLVYSANYHKGEVIVYKQATDGSLTVSDKISHQALAHSQQTPHAHFANLTPDQLLAVCDLGLDQIVTYEVDEQGKLHHLDTYHSADKAGPRHLVFHPSFKVAYLICERNATIEVLFYDGMGEFHHFQTISTLPQQFTGENACAAIILSQDGKFLYASNRGHNSIAVYSVLADGSLALVEIVPSKGDCPRDITLTPDQHYLIAVHQLSNQASVFRRNPKTGQLQALSYHFAIPEPVCVLFR